MQTDLYGNKVILFYGRKDEYGWLSNFERSPIVIDGMTYPTNEHYYQDQKANTEEFRKWISDAPNPYAAMKAGRSLRTDEMRFDWENVKFDIMLKGLRAKFNQHDYLRKKLIETGDMQIHEDSPTDMVWGIKGMDMLGKLIMKVREELKNGINPT